MASTDGDDLAALSFAIKLLHSSAADSADKIRVLLDKEIEKRYGPERTVATVLSGSIYPQQGITSNIAKEEQECHKIAKDKLSRHSDKKNKKRKTKAHNKDRGKLKLSSFQNKCLDGNVETEKSASKSSERRSSGMQFSTQDNAKCVICKQVRNGGTLLECQECQKFYHQDCHHPPALEINVRDPRHVWYCNKCKIAMGKASKVAVAGKTFSDSISSALESTHSLKQAVQKIAAKAEEVSLSMQPNIMSGNPSSKGKMKTFQRDPSASRKTTTRQQTPKIESTLKYKPLALNTGSKQHNSSQLCNRPTTSPLIAQMKAKQLPLSHVKTATSLSRDQTNLHCSTHGTRTKRVPSKCDIQMKAQKKADPSNFGVQHKAVSTSEGQTNPELSASTSHIKPQLSSASSHSKSQLSSSSSHNKPQLSASISNNKPQLSSATSHSKPQILTSSSHNKPQLSASTSINKPQLSATAIRTKPQLSTSTGNKPRLSASTSNIKPCLSAATSHNKPRLSASTSNIIPPSASKSHNKPRPSVSTSHAKPQPSDSTTSRIYPKPTDSGKSHFQYGV